MPLPRQWSYPAESVSTTFVGEAVVQTPNSSSDPGFNLAADSVQVPTLITAPPASASVANTYGPNTASVTTVVQNKLGYDAMFVGYFSGAASVATFQVGVSSASVVPVTTVATSITGTSQTWDFPAYVPTNYYYGVNASQANGASVNSTLTVVANPV